MFIGIANKDNFIIGVMRFFNLDEKGANTIYDCAKQYCQECGFFETEELYITKNNENFIIQNAKYAR